MKSYFTFEFLPDLGPVEYQIPAEYNIIQRISDKEDLSLCQRENRAQGP